MFQILESTKSLMRQLCLCYQMYELYHHQVVLLGLEFQWRYRKQVRAYSLSSLPVIITFNGFQIDSSTLTNQSLEVHIWKPTSLLYISILKPYKFSVIIWWALSNEPRTRILTSKRLTEWGWLKSTFCVTNRIPFWNPCSSPTTASVSKESISVSE